jgi:hypothetical protein
LVIAAIVASSFQVSREPHGPPWPAIACFITLYGGLILFSLWCMGYLIEVFRQGTRQADQELPPSKGLLRTVGNGFVVALMSFLAVLPAFLAFLGCTFLAGGAVFAAGGPLIRWDETLGSAAAIMGAVGVLAGYFIGIMAFNIALTMLVPLLHVRYAATGDPLSYFHWLWALGVLRRAGGAYFISQIPMLSYWILYMTAYFTTFGFGCLAVAPLIIPFKLNQAYRTGRFYAEHLSSPSPAAPFPGSGTLAG